MLFDGFDSTDCCCGCETWEGTKSPKKCNEIGSLSNGKEFSVCCGMYYRMEGILSEQDKKKWHESMGVGS